MTRSSFLQGTFLAALLATALINQGCLSSAEAQGPKAPATVASSDGKSDSLLDHAKLGEPLPRNLWVELSKLINPAVVSITTSTIVRQSPQRYRDPIQEFLEQFYGGGAGGGEEMQQQRQPPMTALGTGFIIREDGLIITNNHVVEQADIIKVQLDNDNGKLYEAEVIGRDQRTDIALIKIDAKHPLPFVKLGSSKALQVGEYVAAFGNPYGHSHTMTTGIVSALGREIAEINKFPFIQTDASINPGNSGGPLVNFDGYVIGVNAAIDARAQGIGFAIPIDNVKNIIALLEKDGRVKRGYIGVGLGPITDELAQSLGMEEPHGVLVAQVQSGGPADRAGLQPYDIIHEVGGKKTDSLNDLQNAIGDTLIGTDTKIKVWRYNNEGRRKDLSFKVGVIENPAEPRKAAKQTKQYYGQKAPFNLGFKVVDWSAKSAKDLGVESDVHGPIVTDVDPSSPASLSGISTGDIVIDVNRQKVARATDVLRLLKKGRNFIRFVRRGTVIIVTIGT
jgi:serine protease Do